MAFALSGFGILHALTISSAGGADNPSPYVTLKIEVDAQSIDAVAAAVGAGTGDMHALKHLHDLPDPLMPPALAGITSIDTWYEARARHTLTYAGVTTRVAKVSGVRIKPSPRGQWTITCSIGIDDPPQHALDRLAQALKGMHKITLEADPELDLKPASAQTHPYDAAVGTLKRMAAQDGCAVTLTTTDGTTVFETEPKRGKPADKRSPAA